MLPLSLSLLVEEAVSVLLFKNGLFTGLHGVIIAAVIMAGTERKLVHDGRQRAVGFHRNPQREGPIGKLCESGRDLADDIYIYTYIHICIYI